MPLFRYPALTHDCLKGGSRRAAEWDGGKKSITSDFTLLRVTTAAAVWQETVLLTIHGQVRASSSSKPLDAELFFLTLISAQLREREALLHRERERITAEREASRSHGNSAVSGRRACTCSKWFKYYGSISAVSPEQVWPGITRRSRPRSLLPLYINTHIYI